VSSSVGAHQPIRALDQPRSASDALTAAHREQQARSEQGPVMRHTKLIVGGLVATIAMTCAVATASANKFSISNRNLRVVWSSLEFREPAGFFGTIKCPVTLEGSFNYNTTTKSPSLLIGRISKASVASSSCTGGHATVLQETLPWHLTYLAFFGRLPIVTKLQRLWLFSLRLESALAGNCLASATAEHEGALTDTVEAGGNITSVTPAEERQIPLTGEPSCSGSTVTMTSPANDGQMTQLGVTSRIKLTLI
jgi:hypothetical protein